MAGTWIYSRSGKEVSIRHVEHEDRAELIVEGLGPTQRHEFTSLEALLLYVTTLERDLFTTGWSLSFFQPEKRNGMDRRGAPRFGVLDRRRIGRVLLFPAQQSPLE